MFTAVVLNFHKHIVVRAPLYPFNREISDANIMEAIFLASNVVHKELNKRAKESINKKEAQKLDISLYKYRVRASHRCTPFGLFAGIFLGEWSDETKILLSEDQQAAFERKTRLDMNIVCAIANTITQHPSIKPYIRYYPNSSLYRIADYWRYIESNIVFDQKKYKLSQVQFNEYIELIFKKCSKGLKIAEIVGLFTKMQFELNEVKALVDDLISSGLIVGDLEPNVTGMEFFDVILTKCEDIYSISKDTNVLTLINTLKQIKDAVIEADINPVNYESNYMRIHGLVNLIIPEVNYPNLLQTDVFIKPLVAKVNKIIKDKLITTLNFINKITPNNENQLLVNFKKRFYERYEDYEVPLLIALDCETGVGYPNLDIEGINPLIDEIYTDKSDDKRKLDWDELQSILLSIITKAIADGKRIIEITDEDFAGIDFTTLKVPQTMTVMFKILDSDKSIVEFNAAGGCSAINLISRFGNKKKEIDELIKELAKIEEIKLPNKVIAEIVHLPEARTGNILARPTIRNYEIPYLAQESVDKHKVIALNDIMISIRNNRVILRSKVLNKEIIPRLSNAHNYTYKSLPVYQFLCDMQGQYFGKTAFIFNWGVLEREFVFLPRVVYKGVIIKRARWYFKIKHFAKIMHCKTEKDSLVQLQYFITQYKLPSRFLFCEGDNELMIDTNIYVALETFIDLLKKNTEVYIKEYLEEEVNPLIKDLANGAYSNECLGIIIGEDGLKEMQLKELLNCEIDEHAISTVGDKWVYYKIYCGVKTSDKILVEYIYPIIQNLCQNHLIEKSFFVRYVDPNFHLRIRFLLDKRNAYEDLISVVHEKLQPLVVTGVVNKIQIDTYKRELIRYGYNTITHAETIFHNDSDFVLHVLAYLNEEQGHELRWKIAIISIDRYLDDFGLDQVQKMELYEKLSNLFYQENFNDKKVKKILDNKYRNHADSIKGIFDSESKIFDEIKPIIEMLIKRKESNKAALSEILKLQKVGTLDIELENMLSSFLHMSLNRIFMGRNRVNEFVVYYYLAKYYRSIVKREIYIQTK